MGTATLGAYTLTSVVKVNAKRKAVVAEHQIPGTASIVQAVGRTRSVVTITGILNPSSEITAVGNIMSTLLGNTAPFTASAVTDSTGTDWVGGTGSTYFVMDVNPESEPGTAKPWGSYSITLIEVA